MGGGGDDLGRDAKGRCIPLQKNKWGMIASTMKWKHVLWKRKGANFYREKEGRGELAQVQKANFSSRKKEKANAGRGIDAKE